MAKGYWIALVSIKDPEIYKEYVAANAVAFKKYGAKFIIRGGKHETKAGADHQRHVVIEFDSFETAKACYDSPEYAVAMKIRDKAADAQVVVVEGYDG